MTIHGTTVQALVNQPSRTQGSSFVQEATETTNVTRQEANNGDQVAIRKLAKEEASKAGNSAPKAPTSTSTANQGGNLNIRV